jgi:hypothetical protein
LAKRVASDQLEICNHHFLSHLTTNSYQSNANLADVNIDGETFLSKASAFEWGESEACSKKFHHLYLHRPDWRCFDKNLLLDEIRNDDYKFQVDQKQRVLPTTNFLKSVRQIDYSLASDLDLPESKSAIGIVAIVSLPPLLIS